MLSLLLALYCVGGAATYEELRVLLEHDSLKAARNLVSRAAGEGLVFQPGVPHGLVRLTERGAARLKSIMLDPMVVARTAAARAARDSQGAR